MRKTNDNHEWHQRPGAEPADANVIGLIGPFELCSGCLPGFASPLVEGILQNLYHVGSCDTSKKNLPVNARKVEPLSEAADLTHPPPLPISFLEVAVPQGTLAL